MGVLLRIQPLIVAKVLSGAGGDNPQTTGIIDMRRLVRVEALFARGTDLAGSQPDFDVEWIGGVQSTYYGDPLDAFQTFGDNDKLLVSTGNEKWQQIVCPDFKSPYVQFRVVSKAGSPITSTYWLYAYMRDRFDP